MACQRALRGDLAPLVALLEALLEMKNEGAEIDVTAGSNAEVDNGWNPLMFSVKTQCMTAVNLSLEFVDVNAKAAGGECALSIAAESGNKKLFARLTEAGAHDHKRKYKAQLLRGLRRRSPASKSRLRGKGQRRRTVNFACADLRR